MAVTLTERFKADIGGKKLIIYECTLAVSTNAITAASLELTYIEASWISNMQVTTSLGCTTSTQCYSGPVLKYMGASTGITISGVVIASDKVVLGVVGW